MKMKDGVFHFLCSSPPHPTPRKRWKILYTFLPSTDRNCSMIIGDKRTYVNGSLPPVPMGSLCQIILFSEESSEVAGVPEVGKLCSIRGGALTSKSNFSSCLRRCCCLVTSSEVPSSPPTTPFPSTSLSTNPMRNINFTISTNYLLLGT